MSSRRGRVETPTQRLRHRRRRRKGRALLVLVLAVLVLVRECERRASRREHERRGGRRRRNARDVGEGDWRRGGGDHREETRRRDGKWSTRERTHQRLHSGTERPSGERVRLSQQRRRTRPRGTRELRPAEEIIIEYHYTYSMCQLINAYVYSECACSRM